MWRGKAPTMTTRSTCRNYSQLICGAVRSVGTRAAVSDSHAMRVALKQPETLWAPVGGHEILNGWHTFRANSSSSSWPVLQDLTSGMSPVKCVNGCGSRDRLRRRSISRLGECGQAAGLSKSCVSRTAFPQRSLFPQLSLRSCQLGRVSAICLV
jgi:hypothetical protein